mmetsp:Transcript_50389/g.140998  ORF Transcript_50389/g.140998 Transcript_50389/m.140998 type:complete len:232 (+) Transcript_50389:63-758(+)
MIEPFFLVKLGPVSCFCSCDAQGVDDSVEDVEAHRIQSSPRDSSGVLDPKPLSVTSATGEKVFGDAEEAPPRTADPEACAEKAEAGESDRCDYSGSWVLASVQGDWDSFMTDMGYPWAKRKAIKMMGFGVGKLREEIQQEGDTIKIITLSPAGAVENSLTVDGTEQDTIDPDRRALRSIPTWAHGALVTSSVEKATQKPIVTTRRHMQGRTMCVELRHAGGTLVRRFFERE